MSGFDFGPGRAKREPNADMRIVARGLREFYTAQVDEGFSKTQAMQLTLKFLEVTLTRGIAEGDNG
jgi:hypothetical protein